MRTPIFTSMQEAIASNAKIKYVAGKDGKVYEIRESLIGRMVAAVPSIPTFEEVQEGFEFHLPKIPGTFLGQIISFFQAYTKKGSYEVMIRIYWDQEQQTYIMECPKQYVSRIRIDAEYDERFLGRNSIRFIPVLEVHSHNIMRAFFSPTDDEDEQAYRIYGVIGRLNRKEIECLFRVKVNETSVPVKLTDIFDLTSIQPLPYPSEWDEKVIVKRGQLL